MTEPERQDLRARRRLLLEQLSRAVDEIMKIDDKLSFLQNQEHEA